MKNILYLIVCCSAMLDLAADTLEQQKKLEMGRSLYLEGKKWVDRSLCRNIALTCNEKIKDKYISAKDRNVKITIIDSISESSGSYYVGCSRGRKMRAKTKSSYTPIGGVAGGTSNGGSFAGTLYGKQTTTSYKVGDFETTVTDDLSHALLHWKKAAGYGNPQACAEYAAAMFIEATKGDLANSKMYRYFKIAADGGVLHARFMQAICLQYGIGVAQDSNSAKKLCESWFNDYCEEVAKSGGGSLDDPMWVEKAVKYERDKLSRWNHWATRRINDN